MGGPALRRVRVTLSIPQAQVCQADRADGHDCLHPHPETSLPTPPASLLAPQCSPNSLLIPQNPPSLPSLSPESPCNTSQPPQHPPNPPSTSRHMGWAEKEGEKRHSAEVDSRWWLCFGDKGAVCPHPCFFQTKEDQTSHSARTHRTLPQAGFLPGCSGLSPHPSMAAGEGDRQGWAEAERDERVRGPQAGTGGRRSWGHTAQERE